EGLSLRQAIDDVDEHDLIHHILLSHAICDCCAYVSGTDDRDLGGLHTYSFLVSCKCVTCSDGFVKKTIRTLGVCQYLAKIYLVWGRWSLLREPVRLSPPPFTENYTVERLECRTSE